jgi:hypothetical protein
MICMVKNPNSRPGYVEEFDGEALHELAEMAKNYVRYTEYKDKNDVLVYLHSIPNGAFSDFSVSVWEIMTDLVRYGIRLAEDHRDS